MSLFFLIPSQAPGAWPEGPWLGNNPNPNAKLSAMVFGTPLDAQFNKVLETWKIFSKKYNSFDIDFLAVARSENTFPFLDSTLNQFVKNYSSIPIFKDSNGLYSKQWRAYVSPTVILVRRDGRVINFDPGNYDSGVFERSIQKHIKEYIPNAKLPSKENNSENEKKTCSPSKTYFLGSELDSVWDFTPILFDGNWDQKPRWLEPILKTLSIAQMHIPISAGLHIVAESTGTPIKLKLTYEGQKLEAKWRGKDVLESKDETYVTIKTLLSYELTKEIDVLEKKHLLLSSDSRLLRVWAVQTLPKCRSN